MGLFISILLVLIVYFFFVEKKSQEFEKRYESLLSENRELEEQLRTAQQQLQKVDEEKSEFISIASHQLRTPTTIIKGFISMLLDGDFGTIGTKPRATLEKVNESTDRLIALIEDLLNISRLESKTLRYHFQKRDLVPLVQDVIEMFHPLAMKKQLKLELVMKNKSLPLLFLDEDKIRQVLKTLIENALLYTGKGIIQVLVERSDGGVLLQVKDTGIGMVKEGMARLFEKFSRIKEGKIVNAQGSGLKLFVAKKLIEAHGGKIWAQSSGTNKGSMFSVFIKARNTPPKMRWHMDVKNTSTAVSS